MSYPQGVHDIADALYHADCAPGPSLSNSLIKTLLGKTPRHAWLAHPRLNPDYKPYTADKFDIGSAAHDVLLQGGESVAIIDAEDWRTKAAKEARSAARASGKTPILARQWNEVGEMSARAAHYLSTTQLAGCMSDGLAERTAIAQLGDVWCRGKLDLWVPDDALIIDYKTTSASNPADWMRSSMSAYGYDTQDDFYRRLLLRVTGIEHDFLFLVQEDSPPYECFLVRSGESKREVARHKVARALTLWADCLRADSWPGYPTDVHVAEAANWEIAEAEMYALLYSEPGSAR